MKRIVLIVDAEDSGQRLDRFLAAAQAETSRSEVQRDIRAGRVSVDAQTVTQSSYRLRESERIAWSIPERDVLMPRPIPLDILYEDDHLVVVDKPIDLVVHPGAGTRDTTLVEGLLVDRELPPSDDPTRPGIVHRLDKETSGVIVVAKSAEALTSLQRQFAERTVRKAYVAQVDGAIPEEAATIDAPIGRDPAYPRRMAIRPEGRSAQTDVEILQRFDHSTLLLAHPRTGRTHQLRVHLAYIKHSVLGDSVYGRAVTAESHPESSLRGTEQVSNALPRRMHLHAWRLEILHPATRLPVRFEAPVPEIFPAYPYEEIAWSE